MMLLSDRLQKLRRRFGYSQATLADKLSISRMAYTQYETGHRQPSLDMLVQFSILYQVSTDYLLGLSDLSRLPKLTPFQCFLLSQLDRLPEERREYVFQILQQELGQQMLSDASQFFKDP